MEVAPAVGQVCARSSGCAGLQVGRSGQTRGSGWRQTRGIGASLALFLITLAASGGAPDLELPFQLDSRYDAILIQAEVNGKPATLLLDTGAAQTILDAQLLGLTNLDLKMSRFSQSGPGLRGEALWAEARLKLGVRTWHEQRVVAMNLEPLASRYGRRIHGLLGQDILRQFARVTIDFRTRTLILVPSANEPANANLPSRKNKK